MKSGGAIKQPGRGEQSTLVLNEGPEVGADGVVNCGDSNTNPCARTGGVAFFQRAFFGGPTKRIPGKRIDTFSWRDVTSLPYLIRRRLDRFAGAKAEVDLSAPGRPIRRTILKAVSFAPTALAMAVPIVVGGWGRGWDAWPSASFYPQGLIAFTLYLIACVGFELVSSWRAILIEIGVGPKPTAPVTNDTPS